MYKKTLTCFYVVMLLLLCNAPALMAQSSEKESALQPLMLTQLAASRFARLALQGMRKEFPNKLDHVMNHAGEVKSPKELHPAFYSCYDWHSCVHGHWMLVRLLRQFPDLPEAAAIRSVLDENLTEKNIQAEVAYLKQPSRQSFERTYGWAWLLKLAEELYTWDNQDARRWYRNLQPLADAMVAAYLNFLPRQHYPIRTGVHPNTAFGLAFALDYAHAVNNTTFIERLCERSRTYFAADAAYPAAWEPGGEDFFSPALMEADLMRRVLGREEFQTWLHRFLPGLREGIPASLLHPAIVTDRSDPKLVHLDGLNLSRAWCMRSIAAVLPEENPARQILTEAARLHAHDALEHVASGDYVGEHWLASFAVYMLSTP